LPAGCERLSDVDLDEAELGTTQMTAQHVAVNLAGFGKVLIHELPFADGVMGSTGGQLWPASVELGKYFLGKPWLVAGKSVIELGAGCGFASVIVARLARWLLVTDGDEEIVDIMRQNLICNASFWRGQPVNGKIPPKDVFTQVLQWENINQLEWPEHSRVDVIIGSDIAYKNNHSTELTQVTERLLKPGGTFYLFSETKRGGTSLFNDRMQLAGFDVEVLPHTNAEADNFTVCIFTTPADSSDGSRHPNSDRWGAWNQREMWEEVQPSGYPSPYYCNIETGEIVWSLEECGALPPTRA